MRMGYDREDWAGRPVIAIINTWSDINPCHAHFKQRVEDVKRGVLQADAASRRVPVIANVRAQRQHVLDGGILLCRPLAGADDAA